MRFKWLGSITSMLVAAGTAFAQAPAPVAWTDTSAHAAEHLPAPGDVTAPAVSGPAPALIPNLPAPTLTGSCTGGCGDRLKPLDNIKHNEYDSGSDADFWFSTEYLLWWIKDGRLPALVGTIPTLDAQSGRVGNITTIYGGSANNLQYHEQSGVRFSTGMWFNECHTVGVDASFFQLEHKTQGAVISSPGDPVIGPVFFDPAVGRQTIIIASMPATNLSLLPTQRSATIGIQSNNQLWGAELNGRYQLGALFFMDRLDLIAGFRHLYFGEGLDVTTSSTALPPGNPERSDVLIADHFGVRTQFYGGQVGLASHGQAGRLSFDGVFKFAMGNIHEVVNIDGSTTFSGGAGRPTAFPGGVLAQPTNIGHNNMDRFGILPELTLTVGYQVLPHLRATLGYNFLYLSNVVRAGDQIDGVDARQVRSLGAFDPSVRAVRPTPTFFSDRFYAQGLNAGLEFSF